MNELLGQRLGNYRIERLPGRGGFADVYLGVHVHLGTDAALKVLPTQLVSEEQERFLKEAQMVARLLHPHIVRVLDFGIERTQPFLVMEYAPHGSLRRRYPKGTSLTAQEALPFVQQVAAVLQYAHEQHIIHRDVKPENMLLNQQNAVLLSDFGIAVITHTTRSASMQEVVGTVAYMAPEQIQGNPQSASDQYALGVTLYEWLSGSWPFQGSFTEMCSQHLTTPPPPLHDKFSSISPAIEAVVRRALAKEPAQRFPTVLAFAEAFEAACQSDVVANTGDAPTIRRSLAETQYFVPETPKETNTVLAPARTVIAKDEVLPGLPSTPDVARRKQEPIQPSRRTILITGAGAVGLIAVGGFAWFLATHSQSPADTKKFTVVPSPTPSTTPTNAPGTTLLTFNKHSRAVYGITQSPNGLYLASASADTTVQVWEAATGKTLYTYQGHAGLLNSVFSVDWSADGQYLASGSADTTAQVWEAATNNRTQTYQEHTASVLSVAWSPDTKYLASSGVDKTVQVWEARTGNLQTTYRGHSGLTTAISAVAWSPNGALIASGSTDTTVQIWETASAKPVFTYRDHSGTVYSVIWQLNGQTIASGSADHTVKIWQAPKR